MSIFSDQLLLRFLQDDFVQDLLTNQLGLVALFELVYELRDTELKQLELAGLQRREFAVPAFETLRTDGVDERIMPTADRVKVQRAQPRHGRLAWIDVFLDVLLAAKVASTAAPVQRITTRDLLDQLGGVDSLAELRDKLATLYPPSVVDAFFERFHITSVVEFKRRPMSFIEFVYQAPPPFDPDEPKNARCFPMNVCVQFQPELKIGESLQAAKLSRSILENERDFVPTFDDGDIDTPYAFVVLFPDSAVVDGALPNLTAEEIKAGTRSLFQAERMLAHFVTH